MIIFDTETTGLPLPEGAKLDAQPEIIEIGALKVDWDTLEVQSAFSTLIRPKHHVPEIITKITSITEHDVKDAPEFIEVLPELSDFFLGQRELLAHNLPFDRTMLRLELERIDKVMKFPWPPKQICTGELSKLIYGGPKRKHLEDWFNELFPNSARSQDHRALSDAEQLLEIVRWMRKEGHI